MTRLPIVDRELRVSSRQRATYWGRVAAAGLLLGVAALFLLSNVRMPPRDAGPILFYILTAIVAFFCLFAGPVLTADCLSRERREGTLGLLFLTDLTVYDILLGKLAANSLRALYGLVGVLPVLCLPLLVGGVTPGECLRVALALGNILLLSLAAGIFSSVLFKTAQNSVGWCVIFLGVITFALPMFVVIYAENQNHKPNELWLLFSPGFAYFSASAPSHTRYAAGFWLSNAILLAGSAALLMAAARRLPHIWQDRPAPPKRQRVREFLRDLQLGKPAARTAHRRAALDANAYFWLATRQLLKRKAIWAGLAFFAAVWLGALVWQKQYWLTPATYGFTAGAVLYLFRFILISECVDPIAGARSLNALELLLSTPLSVRDIAHGQWLALRWVYLRPFLACAAVMLVLFGAGLWHANTRGDAAEWCRLWFVGLASFAVDVVAIFWMSLWTGASGRSAQHAVGNTMMVVMMPPWILLGLLSAGLSLLFLLEWWRPPTIPGWVVMFTWLGLNLLCSLGAAWRCRRQMMARFRQVAAERYQPRNFWGRRSTAAASA